MITRIPATMYRGGTSKGPLFLASDLPNDPGGLLDSIMLAAMGSPHPRQIDGIGGAESLTSKIAIVSKSARPDADVDYFFVQVNPNSSIVDYASNCGNMLSAVGPFAIEKGLVKANHPTTSVRIYNTNTESLIVVELQTPRGEVTYEGGAAIDGVTGTAAPVRCNFAKTIGSKTKKLLPTDKIREVIDDVEVTLIDVAVPLMIVPANAVGKRGNESKAELDADKKLISRLESMRNEAGRRMGLGDTSKLVIPKPILVSQPTKGGVIASRDFVPYNCHATHSVTGAMALSTACVLAGTVAADYAVLPSSPVKNIVIEHPSGVIEVETESTGTEPANFELKQASLIRTCRKLFEGWVCIPSRVWDGRAGLEQARRATA
ncbi:4-oxalomesaconate tautomerase [Bradyrhizobium sp. Tv2a-2]|uniref:4-oxalomesaconate tautomerase n=1 Tax=Bradyrhizobium sp. Tv2a-2 TaxID=113395 RepID=UPI00041BF451|nr:4-oxalomesaconate tautomerase [Bradyrhizobium sp. Tv2a-2]